MIAAGGGWMDRQYVGKMEWIDDVYATLHKPAI